MPPKATPQRWIFTELVDLLGHCADRFLLATRVDRAPSRGSAQPFQRFPGEITEVGLCPQAFPFVVLPQILPKIPLESLL